MKQLSISTMVVYFVLVLISVVSYIIFIGGFYYLGKKHRIKSLKISSLTLMIGAPIVNSPPFIPEMFPGQLWMLFAITILFCAIIGIPFGIGLIRLTEHYGILAKTTGILNLISSLAAFTIILIFVPLLLLFPTVVLEILLLHKAGKKLKQH